MRVFVVSLLAALLLCWSTGVDAQFSFLRKQQEVQDDTAIDSVKNAPRVRQQVDVVLLL